MALVYNRLGLRHEKPSAQVTPLKAARIYQPPRCLAGGRACPPEDCGGVPGYERMLEIVGNPKDEEHEEMLEWLGDEFDPEAFDLDVVNEELGEVR